MRHRWIVKVEPDSVVVVPRLRTLLSKIDPSVPLVLAGKPGQFWDGHMEGAIIPLSSAGLAQYARRREKCERNHTFRDGKGEDWYLGVCANEIGVRSLFIPLMVYASLAATDLLDVCTRPLVAFHGAALKNGDGYHKCAQLAQTAEESPPCTDVWPHCAAHNKRGCAGAARLVQRSARLLRTAATMCAQCQPFDNDANWWLSHCRRTCGLCAPNTTRHVPVDRQLHHATKHRRRHSDASSVALRKEGIQLGRISITSHHCSTNRPWRLLLPSHCQDRRHLVEPGHRQARSAEALRDVPPGRPVECVHAECIARRG